MARLYIATAASADPVPAARQGVATTVRTGPVPAPGQGVANTASAGALPPARQNVATAARAGAPTAAGQNVATTVRTGAVPAPGQGVANTAGAGAESAAEISAFCDRAGKKVGGKAPHGVGADRSVGGKGTGVVGGGKHMNDEREQDSDEEDESEDGDDEDYKDEDDEDDKDDEEDSDKMKTEDDDEGDGCAENADVLGGYTLVKRFNKKDKNGWKCIEPTIDEYGCPTTCGYHFDNIKTIDTCISNHMRLTHNKIKKNGQFHKNLLFPRFSKTKQTRKNVSKQNHSAEEVPVSEDDVPEEDNSSRAKLRSAEMETNALNIKLQKTESAKNDILASVENYAKNIENYAKKLLGVSCVYCVHACCMRLTYAHSSGCAACRPAGCPPPSFPPQRSSAEWRLWQF